MSSSYVISPFWEKSHQKLYKVNHQSLSISECDFSFVEMTKKDKSFTKKINHQSSIKKHSQSHFNTLTK